MPKKQHDKVILAEIREVIRDVNQNFMIKNYTAKDGSYDRLGEDIAYGVIEDIITGNESAATRDYKKTKRYAARAAHAAS